MVLSENTPDLFALTRAQGKGLTMRSSTGEIVAHVDNIARQYAEESNAKIDHSTTRFAILADFVRAGFISDDQLHSVARKIDPAQKESRRKMTNVLS